MITSSPKALPHLNLSWSTLLTRPARGNCPFSFCCIFYLRNFSSPLSFLTTHFSLNLIVTKSSNFTSTVLADLFSLCLFCTITFVVTCKHYWHTSQKYIICSADIVFISGFAHTTKISNTFLNEVNRKLRPISKKHGFCFVGNDNISRNYSSTDVLHCLKSGKKM